MKYGKKKKKREKVEKEKKNGGEIQNSKPASLDARIVNVII